jgi:hypothetical protein
MGLQKIVQNSAKAFRRSADKRDRRKKRERDSMKQMLAPVGRWECGMKPGG